MEYSQEGKLQVYIALSVNSTKYLRHRQTIGTIVQRVKKDGNTKKSIHINMMKSIHEMIS